MPDRKSVNMRQHTNVTILFLIEWLLSFYTFIRGFHLHFYCPITIDWHFGSGGDGGGSPPGPPSAKHTPVRKRVKIRLHKNATILFLISLLLFSSANRHRYSVLHAVMAGIYTGEVRPSMAKLISVVNK
jgi:hypothetical protein